MNIPLMILVPARGGSKRLPNKNLRELGGCSLIKRVADVVNRSGIDAPVILSTDSKLIAEEGLKEGMQVPFFRPENISEDKSPTIDVVIHALDWFKNKNGHDPDKVMLLQPTSPFRSKKMLIEALECLKSREDIESVISMSAMEISSSEIYNLSMSGHAVKICEKDSKPFYIPNGAIYLTRTKALRREHSLFAEPIHPLVTDPLRSIDIDTSYDWKMAELLESYLENNPE
tara:strand:+ start:16082 stop:16771 length:690 start_codon:yes stop_codon:yes gene_type:complete